MADDVDRPKLALLLEYDGTAYHGFQAQRRLPTIQGELEQALHRLTNKHIRIRGAGRTDAGAHARGQVASFATRSTMALRAYLGGLNHYLPPDIAVLAVARVGPDFDARWSARSRVYRYLILNRSRPSPLWRNRALRIGAALDTQAMARVAVGLKGRRDMRCFVATSGLPSTTRTVYRAEVGKTGELVHFEMECNGFLPHMMRNLVAALVKVGTGNMSEDAFRVMAEGRGPVWRGASAPAHGLYLMRVNYGDEEVPWELG